MACCCSYRMGQTGLLEPENAAAAVRFNPLLCLANALLTPFLLAWHSLRIYVLPHIIPEHYLATLDQEEEIEDHLEQGIDG